MQVLFSIIILVLSIAIAATEPKRPPLKECKSKLIYEFLDAHDKVMAMDSADQLIITNHSSTSFQVGKKIVTPENIRVTLK